MARKPKVDPEISTDKNHCQLITSLIKGCYKALLISDKTLLAYLCLNIYINYSDNQMSKFMVNKRVKNHLINFFFLVGTFILLIFLQTEALS